MSKLLRNAGVYFSLQALGVAAWWALLLLLPDKRVYFLLEDGSDLSLLAFWLPDLILLTFASAAAGVLCFARSGYAPAVAWFVTGGVSYAALYCFAFAIISGMGWLGVTLMLFAMLWSGVFSVGMTAGPGMFRTARESTTARVLIKTYLQIIIVWTLILFVIPYFLTLLEDRIGVERFEFPLQRPFSALLFLLISSLGIASAHAMSRIGRGTPLPLDNARSLVVVGPYAFLRNPMAVSGIGQGLAVALFLGSPLVAIYALTGSMIWQAVFRPLEEDDLSRRFGQDYESYKRNVRCWIPRPTAYQIEGTVDSSNSIGSPLGNM